jgi:glycosyltransferase involved in cell wall biosynthesis
MSKPIVAVCIPSYNYGRFLERCIESVLQQTYAHIEVIISDDCSSDGSDLVIKKFKDERITYIRQSQNLGMVPNWRACLAMTNAPYAMLLGADDYLKPRMIEKCISILESEPKVAFCHTAAEFVNVEGKIVSVTGAFTPSYVCEGASIVSAFLQGKRVCNSASIFRRSYFDSIGGWSDKYKNCMDLDLWFRMLLQWKVGYVGEILTCFRSHSVSDEWKLMQIREDLQFLEDMFDRLPENLQHLHSLREELTVTAYRKALNALRGFPDSPERNKLFSELFADKYFNYLENPMLDPVIKLPTTSSYLFSNMKRYLKTIIFPIFVNIPPLFRHKLGELIDSIQYKKINLN